MALIGGEPIDSLETEPDSLELTEYAYYSDGRLYQVTAKATPTDQVFTYSYDLAGRPYEVQFPSSTGIVARYYTSGNVSGWDANGRLTHLRYTKGSNLLQSFTYTYDPSGNRTSMVETPASGPAITWAYGYDWLDRLTSVTKDSVLQSVYSYDESDNRIQLQMPVLGQTHSYAYDFADRILSCSVGGSVVETFSHDADGNMLARTAGGVTTTYTWNDDNRLISISKPGLSASYRYDSEGIRKSKGSDTRYFSSGAASLADLHPSNSISYIQGHQILGMVQSGSFYWYISDALSTVRLVVDGTGTVVASYASDEFGNQTAATGSADLRQHTYTGGLGVRNDAASGLYYARQRYYDPSVGRWLNADPIGFKGGLNLHAYVGNNPINFVDPSGLESFGPFEIVGNEQQIRAIITALASWQRTQRGGILYEVAKKKSENEGRPIVINVVARGESMTTRPLKNSKIRTVMISLSDAYYWGRDPKCPSRRKKFKTSTLRKLAHELGHSLGGQEDDGPKGMSNIEKNENPVMRDPALGSEQDLNDRIEY